MSEDRYRTMGAGEISDLLDKNELEGRDYFNCVYRAMVLLREQAQTEAAKPVVPESFTPNPAAGIHPVRIIRELIDSHKRDTHGECDESCDIVAGMEAALHAVNEAQVQSCFDSILAPPLPVAQGELVEQLRAALRSVNAVAIERGDKFGACDQIDNDGQPYQSQWLAAMLAAAPKEPT